MHVDQHVARTVAEAPAQGDVVPALLAAFGAVLALIITGWFALVRPLG